MQEWSTDVLGVGYWQKTIPLGSDSEGPVSATLVQSLPGRRKPNYKFPVMRGIYKHVDVLYVHGWSDYFFQKELAHYWTSRGARFFALDLRKYGRSLRDYQTPGYIEDLNDYHEEIDAAVSEISSKRNRKLLLMGHSTGGLVLSLWAANNPDKFYAMILNSPWLEFQLSSIGRKFLMPIVNLSSHLAPGEAGPQLDYGFYTRAQNEVATPDHPLEVNTKWRPPNSMPVRPGWLHAILAGHEKIASKLEIKQPICVMLSSASLPPVVWSEELKRVDSVLTVEEVAKAALNLGEEVTVMRVQGALHDIFLSAPEVREEAYKRMTGWFTGILNASRD